MYGFDLLAPEPDFNVFCFLNSLEKLSRTCLHFFCNVLPKNKNRVRGQIRAQIGGYFLSCRCFTKGICTFHATKKITGCLYFSRYLATGTSFADLHYNYKLGKSTISNIVRQVCTALWRVLKPICMPPISEERWKEISNEFLRYTNFPNCIGAVDGKHIRIVQPSGTGSLYHNYKHFFSTILLAVCDANYCFLYVDVGSYGKSNDSTIFKESMFYKHVSEEKFNIPASKPITVSDNTSLPYIFLGDDAFGLSKNIMCPYVGKQLPHVKKVFNFRLSRARRYKNALLE